MLAIRQPGDPAHVSGHSAHPESESGNFAPALTQVFKERLRPCLNALDDLRSQGLQGEISLPAIAVVGDQSVGKSSVLEAISGVEFPRGLGIVTRCPLMLSMRGKDGAGWTAKIRYETKGGIARDKQLNTPTAIGQAIREAQEEMTSSPAEISEKLIELRIEGPDTPDLTLIDLPGIARFSIAGGGDIAGLTKSLIMSFISKPEVLILIVIPCHVDVETVEAISLAKEVDPHSKRTIGVLTCPDLVNPGSEMEVLAMMRNERLKLLKGFVTVRCRTPQQLKENMNLREACEAEEAFFKTHPQFKALDEYQRGSKTLANKLSIELFEAVKTRVPDLTKEIQMKRVEYTRMLESMGDGPPESEAEMKALLVSMIEKFTRRFSKAAEGAPRADDEDVRLYGACRQHWEVLADAIEECAFSSHTDSHGLMATLTLELELQRGSELLGFDSIFPVLCRLIRSHFFANLKPHSAQFVVAVTLEVDAMVRALTDQIFGPFPELGRFVKQEIDVIKTEMQNKAKLDIEKLYEQEGFVFTQDRIFRRELTQPSNENLQMKKPSLRGPESVGQTAESRANQPDEVTSQNARRILDGAEAYMRIAVRRLQDTLPMAVNHYMLYQMSIRVSHRLLELLTDSEAIFPMLQHEEPELSARRKHVKQLLDNLAEAESRLGSF